MRVFGDVSILDQEGRFGERSVHDTLRRCFEGDERWLAIYGMAVLQLTDKGPFPDGVRPLTELDFLVVNRDLGVLLVEVKGGQIRCKDQQWESRRDHEWRRLERSPMKQAVDGLYSLMHRATATAAIGSQARLILHAALVAFPAVDRIHPLTSDFTPESVAFRDTCAEPARFERWLEAAFHHLQAQHGMRSRSREVAALLDELVMPVVTSEFGIRTMASRIAAGDTVSVVRPGKHDEFVRERELRRRVLVDGPAGSGKTMVGMIRVARALQADPAARALFLSYNLLVADRTRAALSQAFGDRVVVDAYHPFADREIRRAQVDLQVPDDISSRNLHYREEVPQKLELALQRLPRDPSDQFDLLVIDEAQDFNWRWILSLEPLLKPGAAQWALCDPQQFIFGAVASEATEAEDRIAEMRASLSQYFGDPDRLLVCYRMSRAIFRYLGDRGLLPAHAKCDSLAYEGVPPVEERVSHADAPAAVKAAAAHIIRDLGIPPQQILVQTKHRAATERNPLFGHFGRFMDGRYRLAEYPGPDGEHPDAVPCVTISKYKGCERAASIVVESSSMADTDGGNLLYTALTRARLHLHVIRVKDGPAGTTATGSPSSSGSH